MRLLNWTQLGRELRQAADDAHGGHEHAPNIDIAYLFLLENPECFGYEEWPSDMPQQANIELIYAYYEGMLEAKR